MDGHNSQPLSSGQCCDQCNAKVVKARENAGKWSAAVLKKLYQTCGINNAIKEDYTFAKRIMSFLGKYTKMNWGDTCASDSKKNDRAVLFGDDRVVAKYETDKGNVFIITEYDRSATTILFADEY